MADDVYLDGSQPYHRHGLHLIDEDGSCDGSGGPAVPVRVFDVDALAAHDDAIRRASEAGEGTPPTITLDPDYPGIAAHPDWEWVLIDPPKVGEDPHTARVLAGYDTAGVFHRYVTAERLVALFRTHVERER